LVLACQKIAKLGRLEQEEAKGGKPPMNQATSRRKNHERNGDSHKACTNVRASAGKGREEGEPSRREAAVSGLLSLKRKGKNRDKRQGGKMGKLWSMRFRSVRDENRGTLEKRQIRGSLGEVMERNTGGEKMGGMESKEVPP